MKQVLLAVLIANAWLQVSSSGLLAQTPVTLGAVKDNTLYDDPTGSLSNGSGEHMFAGNTFGDFRRRAVIEFDIAGNLPVGSIIDSVELTLYFSRTAAADSANVELHRLLSDWGEGTSDATGEEGSGAPAATNDATWIHTFFNTAFWVLSGGDYSSSTSASTRVGTFFDYGFYTWGSTPEMVADLQGWLDDPPSNHGWILIGDESTFPTSKRFSTRENATMANRPSLTVYYSQAPPPAPVLVSPLNEAVIASDNVTFVWRSILPQVDSYWFELSTDSLFSNPSIDSTLTDTTTTVGQLLNNQTYWWRVRARNGGGFGPFSTVRDFMILITGVDDLEIPGEFVLEQNYPNPFNPRTAISFHLPARRVESSTGQAGLSAVSFVTLRIYDPLGREVATLVNEQRAPGTYVEEFNAEDLSSGVYFCRFSSGRFVQSRKLVLLR